MPDTTDVNLILEINGTYSKYLSYRPVTWGVKFTARLDQGDCLVLSIQDRDIEATVNLAELKNAIAELENFNINQ